MKLSIFLFLNVEAQISVELFSMNNVIYNLEG